MFCGIQQEKCLKYLDPTKIIEFSTTKHFDRVQKLNRSPASLFNRTKGVKEYRRINELLAILCFIISKLETIQHNSATMSGLIDKTNVFQMTSM